MTTTVISERCAVPEHGPTCEGSSFHIRARDKNGCAQFQDGSWLTKDPRVCFEPHLGLTGKSRRRGEGDAVREWLETSFDRSRRPCG